MRADIKRFDYSLTSSVSAPQPWVLNECTHLECTFLLTYWNLTMQHLLNSGVSTGATTCEFDFDLAHASLQHNVYGAKLTFDPVLVM